MPELRKLTCGLASATLRVTVPLVAVRQSHLDCLPADAQLDPHAGLPALLVVAVPWRDDHDPVAPPGQRLGQRPHHVAQAACDHALTSSRKFCMAMPMVCAPLEVFEYNCSLASLVSCGCDMCRSCEEGKHADAETSSHWPARHLHAEAGSTGTSCVEQALSPRAPVLDQGAHSAPTITTFMAFSPAGHGLFEKSFCSHCGCSCLTGASTCARQPSPSMQSADGL